MSERHPVTTGWRAVGVCWDGELFDLGGLNPWEHEWEHVRPERMVVAHPAHPSQRHDLDVWVIRVPDRVVRFAAGELSNYAWAFFLPLKSRPSTSHVTARRHEGLFLTAR